MMSILVSGLSYDSSKGKMGKEVCQVILEQKGDLSYVGISGKKSNGKRIHIQSKEILLLDMERFSTLIGACEIQRPKVIVDYTTPSQALENARTYVRLGIDFVMGTTGFDEKELKNIVQGSSVNALYSQNMSREVAMLMAMLKNTALLYPNGFSSMTLDVVESHQEGKKDVSGTGLKIIDFFQKLGVNYQQDKNLRVIRNPQESKDFGVPDAHIQGHGYHMYTLKSQDGGVVLSFSHNVNGRKTYALGTFDAVKFLLSVSDGTKGNLYSMEDVLKSL